MNKVFKSILAIGSMCLIGSATAGSIINALNSCGNEYSVWQTGFGASDGASSNGLLVLKLKPVSGKYDQYSGTITESGYGGIKLGESTLSSTGQDSESGETIYTLSTPKGSSKFVALGNGAMQPYKPNPNYSKAGFIFTGCSEY